MDFSVSIKTSVYRRFADTIEPYDRILRDLQMLFRNKDDEDTEEVVRSIVSARTNVRALVIALHDLARYDEQTS